MIAIPIDKPKNCNKCPFTCEALQFFNGKDRPNACQLIEIDLVRCGECIHHDDGLCHRPKWSFAVEPTDFCSYGERRADEGINE